MALILPANDRLRNQPIRSSNVTGVAGASLASGLPASSMPKSALSSRTKSGTACSSLRSCRIIMFIA